MEENSHQMNLMISARKLGLRGSSLFPLIHKKIVWQKEIIEAVKDMIHDQDLPMYLWEEETRKTMYV